MLSRIEELDAEIVAMEATISTMFQYYEELACGGFAVYDVSDSFTALVRQRKQLRAQLLADI